MVLQCSLAVCRLDFVGRRGLVDAEDCVWFDGGRFLIHLLLEIDVLLCFTLAWHYDVKIVVVGVLVVDTEFMFRLLILVRRAPRKVKNSPRLNSLKYQLLHHLLLHTTEVATWPTEVGT